MLSHFSCVELFATLWTVARQAPLSMGFSEQKYWSGLPFPTQGNFSIQGLNLGLPHCRQILYYLSHQGIFQARVLERGAIAFSKGSPKNYLKTF